MTNTHNMPALIKGEDGVFRASSLEVAERFDKRHDNVLRTIDTLISKDKNARLRFEVTEYADKNGDMRRCMLMDKATFCVLASKLPGELALEWSIKYVQAFDAMEAALTTHVPQPLTRAQLARNWADAEERAEYEAKRADHNKAVAIAKTAQLAQTESAITLITASEKSITMTEAAKPLGMKPHAFVAWMLANKWIYQSSGGYVANQIRINDGCLEQKFFDRNVNDYIDEYHPARRPQVMVKVKGMAKLAKIFATIEDKAE
jgi:Rha family phage regulatory protein